MSEEKTPIIIKRIKKGGHGHHGGAWKVAYADFVTAMMAFFLVMWIVGLSQKTKEGIQEYFNDPFKYLVGSERIDLGIMQATNGSQIVSSANKGGVTDSNKVGGISRMHLMTQKIETELTQFQSEVYGFKSFPDRIQFAITAQSLFSPGQALLRPEANPLLVRVAKALKNMDAYIMIEAHTDDLPSDNYQYPTNWELSAARAATVVRFFVEGQFFDPAKLTAMAGSEYRPIADNSTEDGRAKNRRIDVYVIPQSMSRMLFRSPAADGAPVDQ